MFQNLSGSETEKKKSVDVNVVGVGVGVGVGAEESLKRRDFVTKRRALPNFFPKWDQSDNFVKNYGQVRGTELTIGYDIP